MARKTINTIGIEYDTQGIRAAEMSTLGTSPTGEKNTAKSTLHKLEEVTGAFVKDEDLVAGLKKIKEKMNMSANDRIVSCISGKQVYVAQVALRRLPPSEILNALKLEIRKNLPFDISGASVDYQLLPEADKKSETMPVLVTAVTHVLISKHLQAFSKAGLKPLIVDALPTAIGNAFQIGVELIVAEERPSVVVHCGPSVCSLIIECKGLPFFHRNIYFAADELFAPADQSNPIPERERVRRLGILSEEVVRSVSYYEKTYSISGILQCYLLGEYTDKPELTQAIAEKSGLQGTFLNLCERFNKVPPHPEKFALAISLAKRTE